MSASQAIQLEHNEDEDFPIILALAKAYPEFFFQAFLRVEYLYTWQRRLLQRIGEKVRGGERHIEAVVRTCHGAGKDFIAAGLTQWFMYTRESPRALTLAPTWTGIKSLLWAEIGRQWNQSLMKDLAWGRLLDTELHLSKGSFAIGMSSDRPAKLEGQHSPTAAMRVVDEAKEIEAPWFDATQGLLNAPESFDLLISTPALQTGEFFERDVHGGPDVIREKVSVDDLIADYRGRGYPTLEGMELWKAKCAEAWGEDSPIFKARCLAEYIVDAGDQALFPISWVERAMAQDFKVPLEPTTGNEIADIPLVLGMDVAGSVAGDRNALALAGGPDAKDRIEVNWLAYWHEQDTMLSKGRALEAAKRFAANFRTGVTHRVDAIGLGKGVNDQLRHDGAKVESYRASDKAKADERFANRKAEDAWGLRERLEKGTIRLPQNDILKAELAAMKYEITTTGKIRVVDPPDSPDVADAVIIATAQRRLTLVTLPRLPMRLH